MRKNVLLLGAMMMASMSLMAQTKGGGISQSALQQMEKSQQAGVANKALFNAIANNNIDDLVKNHANEAPVDTHFSIETPSQSIHNQKSSGRCWMFSGFNVLRSNFAVNDKQGRVVEYSQDYLFFYDQLEKANLMLQGVIDLGKKSIEDPQVQFFFKNPAYDPLEKLLLKSLSLALVFLVLYGRYRSVRLVAMVMVGIPAALVGAVLPAITRPPRRDLPAHAR